MRVVFLNPQGNFDEGDSHLTEHPDFGGQLIYVKEVAKAMASMGVQVDIATRQIVDPQWPEFAGELDEYDGFEGNPRILRVACGGPQFLRKELLWPHLEEFVDNLLARYGERLPDFATAHYADGGYCAALLQAKRGIGFTFTGHSLGAQKLDKLGMSPENFDELDSQFHFARRIAAERLSMERATRIITSTSQERFDQYGHPLYRGAVDPNDDGKFRVIPPGVNTDIFSAEPRQGDAALSARIAQRVPDPGKPSIVVSSRMDEKKNVMGVVRAYIASAELRASANLGIFVRGVDDPWSDMSALPPEQRAILQDILDALDGAQLRDAVFFLDVRSQLELAATYRHFAASGSVFALTAFYEPFGLAPIEAAACGLAVVATRNGGPSEIFADGSGVLVDPADIDSIVSGLREGLAGALRYAELGTRRVHDKYVWSRTAAEYLEVIETETSLSAATEPPDVPPLDADDRLRRYVQQRQPPVS